MPQKSAAEIVADAKKAYVAAGGGKMSSAPVVKPMPAVKPAAATEAFKKVSPTTMSELAARKANTDKVISSLPKLHVGGPVAKDGAYQLKAGEHVLTAPEAARARKHALIHAGLRSMASPMAKTAKAATAKPVEKKASVSVKPIKEPTKKISSKQ